MLQCWALKTALEGMGHEVVVIDRWLGANNWLLERGYDRWGVRQWAKFGLRIALGCGDFAPWLRHRRTKRFVKSLGLTPYHFYEWKDAPKDLGVDCLVVGSDQVWNGGDWGYPDPKPYLLEGAPKIKAIAYAASFGMTELPDEYDYAAGFKRFSAISVREEEGLRLVGSTGAKAVHVVDPTLLIEPCEWGRLGRVQKEKRHVVVYCLLESVEDRLSEIEKWAKATNRTVTIISGRGCLKPLPKTVRMFWRAFRSGVGTLFARNRVRVVASMGPREFVRAFAEADECITNSFHAMMFSSVFKCNLRVLCPSSDSRRRMFARLEEFCAAAVNGRSIVDGLQNALKSLDEDPAVSYRQDVIASRRDKSRQWLESALA